MGKLFYKGEITDHVSDYFPWENNDDKDGVYIYANGDSFHITINDEMGSYYTDEDYVVHDGGSFNDVHEPYSIFLRSYLDKHVDGIKNFDKDTLSIIVSAIERTYKSYYEFTDNLQKELDGGFNTKSAK